MKLQPLHDWVLIRTGEPSDKSTGGIIIPDTAREKPRGKETFLPRANDLVEDKDSKEKVKKKTFVKTTLKPGEHILYDKHAAKKSGGRRRRVGAGSRRGCLGPYLP